MPSTLAAVLDAARVRAFVGRGVELDAFEAALAGRATTRVLFVHGPGGIGKTALLQQFRIRAGHAHRPVVELDAREIDCSTEDFLAAFRGARQGTDGNGPSSPPLVLLLDGYQRLAPLDAWMRSDFLPSLPSDSVIVLAGRDPPAPPWRTDPGWRALAAVYRLGPLTDADSRELLRRFTVSAEQLPLLLGLGHGHPLTLALLADSTALAPVPADLADAPDLVAALVAQIVGEAPDDAHALGFALCAMAWLTTEDLLRCVVGDRATEVWTWLASRPFVTLGPAGLYPHDLVRDVLDADLRRRSPDRYRTVNRIVHQQAIAALRSGDLSRHQLWAHQKLYLHRNSPLSGSFWVLRERGAAAVVQGRPGDHTDVVDLVRRFDGDRNAAIAERWLQAQPEGLSVVRSPSGIAGFIIQVMYPTDPALLDADPVSRAAIDVAKQSPARPGEQISIGRFVSGRVNHERDAYAVLAACVSSAALWISRPLAWSFVTSSDPDFWAPGFDYLGLTPRASVSFDGRNCSVYGIDWRRIPIDVWLEVMAERQITGNQGPIPAELIRPAPLSRTQFDDAVRGALRELHRPDHLRRNALTRSQLVADGSADPAADLRRTLLAGIERVADQQRGLPLGQVLNRTFVHAAPTQEAAAEVLGLPFSTYRRYLAKSIDELIDVLWSVEIGQLRPTAQ